MSTVSQGGRVIKEVFDAEGDLLARSKSPEYWWVFNRQAPYDFLSKHEQGKDRETARLYIAPGMMIFWA